MSVDSQTATIIVNGQEKTIESRVVTWDEVVDLAYPGERTNADFSFIVTYEQTEQSNHDGTLSVGGTVHVKKQGTIFYVARRRRS